MNLFHYYMPRTVYLNSHEAIPHGISPEILRRGPDEISGLVPLGCPVVAGFSTHRVGGVESSNGFASCTNRAN